MQNYDLSNQVMQSINNYYIENQKFDLNQLNIYDHYFDIANLYLFDDGKLIKTIKSDNLNNVTMIKNNLKNNFNNSSTYVFNNSNNYIDYLNNNYGISYLINRNDDEALTKYNNLKNNYDQNKNTIIFYLDNINNDDVLYSYLNIDDDFIKNEIVEKIQTVNKTVSVECGFYNIDLIDDEALSEFQNGKPIRNKVYVQNLFDIPNNTECAVFYKGKFTGLLNKNSEGKLKYSFVIN